MEILKRGSIEKAMKFDEKNDVKVRFECERCGCEFVASVLASECKETLACDPEASTRWYGDCPECGHGCFSDDEVIRDDMDGIKVCGLCKHFETFETDSTRGSCRNDHKRDDDDEEDDNEDDSEHSYDNVHVKTEREAEEVKRRLQERIEETGYATVANLYQLTGNYHTWTDSERGWTSLNSMSWTRTRNRKRPYLLILPRPKDIRDLK